MFLVVGYPRSRTKWFSEFLTYGKTVCLHEPPFDNYVDLFRFVKGGSNPISDSSLVLIWKVLAELRPDIKFLLIKRKRTEVESSLLALGLKIQTWSLDLAEKSMNELEQCDRCLAVDYDDINKRHKEIFKWCLGIDCPPEKTEMIDTNIQLSQAEILKIKISLRSY